MGLSILARVYKLIKREGVPGTAVVRVQTNDIHNVWYVTVYIVGRSAARFVGVRLPTIN